MSQYTLFTCKGTGSALAEAMLVIAGAQWERIAIPWKELGPKGNAELVAANPLGQVPTLKLADGQIITESAAIALHLAETFPEAGLAPAINHAKRPQFLRLLMFLGTAVYAPFTYGDFPDRWVEGEEAGKQLVHSTTEHRKNLWRYLEANSEPGPWLLGDDFSVLDIYLNVMTRWSPGSKWFAEQCPKLYACGQRLDEDPRLKEIWERNFKQR